MNQHIHTWIPLRPLNQPDPVRYLCGGCSACVTPAEYLALIQAQGDECTPEKVAKGALGIDWDDTESAARRVAEYAAACLQSQFVEILIMRNQRNQALEKVYKQEQEEASPTVLQQRDVLATALRAIANAHRFNCRSMTPTQVHATCWEALKDIPEGPEATASNKLQQRALDDLRDFLTATEGQRDLLMDLLEEICDAACAVQEIPPSVRNLLRDARVKLREMQEKNDE